MANAALPAFTVSSFLASLNQTLEYAYPSIEIEGEVASFKVNQGKFVFFDLKDDGGSVGCFMTLWQLRVPVEDGMKVVVRATAKVTPWGKFSLTVQSIRPSGEGSLKKSFELLKAKLDQEGLFALERKRTLPYPPKHIGEISSTQAAGYADFIKILNDRWGGVQVDVAHVHVQGEAAPDQMIRAIKYFNEQEALPEVLVIIRGGGSADDLAAFNDELLVREIAASRIPTLVGVGHEVDESLADLAADVRASTPSNAAQIIVPDRRDVGMTVDGLIRRIMARSLDSIASLQNDVTTILDQAHAVLGMRLDALEATLDRYRHVLAAYNPDTVLSKGYALIRGEIRTGSVITIETKQYEIEAEVTNVKKR